MAGQKIRIRLKAYDHEVIDTSARKIVDTVTRTGAKVAGPVPLPTEKNVYCVIRSPHKYKDSREHFEMRTHKRLIDIIDPTPTTVDSLMRLDLPAGVDIEIKLWGRGDMTIERNVKGLLGTKLGMTQVWDESRRARHGAVRPLCSIDRRVATFTIGWSPSASGTCALAVRPTVGPRPSSRGRLADRWFLGRCLGRRLLGRRLLGCRRLAAVFADAFFAGALVGRSTASPRLFFAASTDAQRGHQVHDVAGSRLRRLGLDHLAALDLGVDHLLERRAVVVGELLRRRRRRPCCRRATRPSCARQGAGRPSRRGSRRPARAPRPATASSP